jgi:hypothetical protein
MDWVYLFSGIAGAAANRADDGWLQFQDPITMTQL